MSGDFRVERRIPLALVAVLLMQTFGALIWAGGAAERIAQAEAGTARVQLLAERAARLEADTASMRETLARIEAKLDRLTMEQER